MQSSIYQHKFKRFTASISIDGAAYHSCADREQFRRLFISRLRRKLVAGGEAPLIRTVRGVGYALRETIHA